MKSWCTTSLLAMLLCGCSGSGSGNGDAGTNGDADAGTPGDEMVCPDKGPLDGRDRGMTTPVLEACHPGWKQQHCGQCHTIPAPHHFIERVPECAGCHGGNGACLPNDPDREHRRSDECATCHGENHNYTDPPDCVLCHFSDFGVEPCD